MRVVGGQGSPAGVRNTEKKPSNLGELGSMFSVNQDQQMIILAKSHFKI